MAEEVYAALGTLYKGMDGGRDPSTLDANTYSKGINVITRGGFIKPRPGLDRFAAPPEHAGVFQGAKTWSLISGDYFVLVTGGYVRVIRVNDGVSFELGLLRHVTNQCFFSQVDRFMVIQDGDTDPVFLDLQADGTPFQTYYADPVEDKKMPIGTIMQYVFGRLHLKPNLVPGTNDDGGRYFVSGDIILADDPRSALVFEESTYLSGGGAHALPNEMNEIFGMSTFRNSATGTGYGALLIFGRNGVSAFDMSLSRQSWATQQLSQVLFYGAGTRSPWSPVNVNDDVLYRSQDGLRSIRYTQSTTAGASALSLSNVPMSQEIREYIAGELTGYLPYVSTAFTDNRFFMTAMGTNDRYFRGLVSLDWANLYTLTQLATPSYDGIWTGLKFGQVLTAFLNDVPTTFVVSGPTSAVYRFDPALTADWAPSIYVPQEDIDLPPVLTPQTRAIESTVITGALAPSDDSDPDFFNQKKLRWLELRVSDIQRDTTFQVYYRPKGYPLWATMGNSFTVQVGAGSLPQTRRKIRFSVPETAGFCDPANKEQLSNGVEFQFAIRLTGYAQLDTIRVMATIEGERPPSPCSETEEVTIVASATAGVALDDFSYVLVES